MQKLLLASILASLFTVGFAQTNVFPSSGNVGVGTTVPQDKLHVVGTIRSDGPYVPGFYAFNGSTPLAAMQVNVANSIVNIGDVYSSAPSFALGFYTADIERLRIDTAGNVGIGTITPSEKLSVNGDISINTEPDGQAIKFVGRSTDGFSQLAFYNNAGSAFTGLLQYHGDGTIAFVNTGALVERMRIAPDGNVGIGAIAPIRALTIGHAASAEMVFQNTGRPSDQRNYRIYSANGGLFFGTLNDAGSAGANHLVIDQASGNVAIGASAPGSSKLAVNGTVRAKEVIVETTGWADDVFADGYALMALGEVKAHIAQHRRLPGVPSTAEVAARGVSVGESQALLLRKVEELTLHLIAVEERLHTLEAENKRLRRELSQ